MKFWDLPHDTNMAYSLKFYNKRMCIKVINNVFINTYLNWCSFFSFSGYGCVGFQNQSNDKICTKVRDEILMFGINFWNHTLIYKNIQILQNQKFMG
jgi:hypothetical protein